jgi:hypothetical protein
MKSDSFVICPSCQALNYRLETFCGSCGAPIGATATLDPVSTIHAQGFLLCKVVEAPPRAIVLIGVWIMLLPALVVSACMTIYLIVNFRGLGNFIFFWLGAGLIVICSVILYRVTRNYFSRRRDIRRH